MSEELKTNQDGIKKPQTLDQLFSATGGVQDPREETPTVSLSGVYVLPDVNRVLDFKQVKEELVTDENGEKRRILVWEYINTR